MSMKVKRQKQVRKILNFYKTNYSHQAPYKVLVDGTFCRAALKCQVNISEQLPKYLDAEVNIVTTRCVLAECEALGTLLYGPLKILRQYKCLSCGHDSPELATVCVKKQAKKKQHKYFIATQDSDLSSRVRKLTGIPLLYIGHNAINLEKPSDASKLKAEDTIKDRLVDSKSEYDKIKELKIKTFGETDVNKKRKRKGPKGPNPLSCKKKDKKIPGNNVPQSDKRKRRRHKTTNNMRKENL